MGLVDLPEEFKEIVFSRFESFFFSGSKELKMYIKNIILIQILLLEWDNEITLAKDRLPLRLDNKSAKLQLVTSIFATDQVFFNELHSPILLDSTRNYSDSTWFIPTQHAGRMWK